MKEEIIKVLLKHHFNKHPVTDDFYRNQKYEALITSSLVTKFDESGKEIKTRIFGCKLIENDEVIHKFTDPNELDYYLQRLLDING